MLPYQWRRILRIMFSDFIEVAIFIILRVLSNCFNKRLTSCSDVPLPFAIRWRRLPL